MSLAERIMMYAIPGFFLLMAIEGLASRLMRRRVYRLSDAINSIGLGTLSQIVGVFGKLLSIGIYAWVLDRVALFALPADRAWVWISGLLLYDFCYYWLHRCGHEVGVLWAAHVVHHQSERYNLSTALRQTSSGVLLGWVFYLPMAVLGYPLEVFAVVAVVDLLYQYWIHTELVPKLGWFDRVFASPSNHRVHHAVNDAYVDKNYGGILILWDRLFGTFVEENLDDPPLYGSRSPLRSWNPLWANVEVYRALALDAWHARRWRDKLRVWLAPPGWRPQDVAARFPRPDFDPDRAEYDPAVPAGIKRYALIHFVLALAMGVHFLELARARDIASPVYAGVIVLTLMSIGALLEHRRGARWLESLRLLVLGGWGGLVGTWPGVDALDIAMRAGFVAVAVISLAALWLALRGTAYDIPASDRLPAA